MALSRTSHTAHLSTTSGTTTTTGSYTFASGSVVAVIVQAILDSTGENPFTSLISLSDTGAGLTWTPFLNIDYGDGDEFGPGIRVFRAIGNGTPCTLTASKTGQNVGRWYIRPFSWSGANTASPIGATMTHSPGSTGGSVSANLNASPASTSDVIAATIGTLNGSAASAITHGTGWTELWDQQSDDWFESQGQVRTGSTSTTVLWDDINPNGISYYKGPVYLAFEVKEAAAGGGAKPWPHYARMMAA